MPLCIGHYPKEVCVNRRPVVCVIKTRPVCASSRGSRSQHVSQLDDLGIEATSRGVTGCPFPEMDVLLAHPGLRQLIASGVI